MSNVTLPVLYMSLLIHSLLTFAAANFYLCSFAYAMHACESETLVGFHYLIFIS